MKLNETELKKQHEWKCLLIIQNFLGIYHKCFDKNWDEIKIKNILYRVLAKYV